MWKLQAKLWLQLLTVNVEKSFCSQALEQSVGGWSNVEALHVSHDAFRCVDFSFKQISKLSRCSRQLRELSALHAISLTQTTQNFKNAYAATKLSRAQIQNKTNFRVYTPLLRFHVNFFMIFTLPFLPSTQPKNFEALKILRNAPPSNIVKTKSQKVNSWRVLISVKVSSYNRSFWKFHSIAEFHMNRLGSWR